MKSVIRSALVGRLTPEQSRKLGAWGRCGSCREFIQTGQGHMVAGILFCDACYYGVPTTSDTLLQHEQSDLNANGTIKGAKVA